MDKTLSIVLCLSLVLSACSSKSQTVSTRDATLTYNSGIWQNFENETGKSLHLKRDAACWIDLKGDQTKPSEGEDVLAASDDDVTLYSNANGNLLYISFELGGETVYGRVGTENLDSCARELMDLAEQN